MTRSHFPIVALAASALAFSGSITQLPGVKVSQRDETIVRRAYLILSTLNRLNRYDAAHSLTHSREEAKKASFISFQVSSLRNGPIIEVLNERLYNLVTPRGGDVATVTRTTHHLNDDPVKFVSYNVLWKTEPQPVADNRSLAAILGNVIRDAKYDRYLQYEVTAIDGARSRTYRAMALFAGSLEDGGTGGINLIDGVVEANSLGIALVEDGLPLRVPFSQFIETPQYRALVDKAKTGQSLTNYRLESLARRVSFSPSTSARTAQDYNCPTGYSPDPMQGCCGSGGGSGGMWAHCCFPYEWTGICGSDEWDVYCPCAGPTPGDVTRDPNNPPSCSQSDDWADPHIRIGSI